MQLHTLKPSHAKTTARRVGRGGKRGKTSGRGTKGQKSRAGHKIRPEMRDLIKKLPKRRGYGKNRSRTVRSNRKSFATVNLSALEAHFTAGETVTPTALVRSGLVRTLRGAAGVKILGTGALTKALTVSKCLVSAAAVHAIETAGGTVTHD
ncbi:MAG: 50S ribosomal protein L15 [Parcubacteria group bacterium 21-54-25]|nr:MAG: 50S ribosomal protein L15 [Parcubacteria group bacterium 21-54-25]HQU08251.1 50S ribosomal protein L15 [Candidatus Paceibacterota bacterium]